MFSYIEIASIGDREDGVCLQFYGQVSRQPNRCRSAMLDPKGRSFYCVSGSLYVKPFSCSSTKFKGHTSYNIKNSRKNENRFTAVSRIKQLDFGMKNWLTFAARAFKIWKSLRDKVVLPVKWISYFLYFSLLYVVYFCNRSRSRFILKKFDHQNSDSKSQSF